MAPSTLRVAVLFVLLAFAPAIASLPIAPPTSPMILPAGLGVNIHFTHPQPGEMEQLAAAGFTFVRMDLGWNHIEKAKGQYDWSAYESLLKSLKPYNIRTVFILDYINPLYDDNESPHTDQGRKAFATWAVAAVKHFAGRGIVWEMYNEPNIHFWRPTPNTDDYIKLALATGKALRASAPNEIYVGPACSRIDFPFLEACFKGGVLEYFDAVSVHPYRPHGPETVAADYRKLRALIEQYKPAGKSIPIFSGEWGYSSAWNNVSEDKQGEMLSRQWLTNISEGIPLSIWYDWHDDGTDPKESEHHFGTVHNDYTPKPAYLAAQELTTTLRGFHFNKRLFIGDNPDDHLLLFSNDNDAAQVVLAAWTTSREGHAIRIGDLSIQLTQTPQYLKPAGELLLKLAAWPTIPREQLVKAPIDIASQHLTRGQPSFLLKTPWSADPPIQQHSEILITNAVTITPHPPYAGRTKVDVANSSGEPFDGFVTLLEAKKDNTEPVHFAAGQTAQQIWITPANQLSDSAFGTMQLLDSAHHPLFTAPKYRYVIVELDNTNCAMRADGDRDVQSTQHITFGGVSVAGVISYNFDAGWKFARLVSTDKKVNQIEGKPKSLSLEVQIEGEPSGDQLHMRFIDATNQTFQPDGPKLNFKEPRFVNFPLDGSSGSHWGGANDGIVHYPIRFDSILLIDSANRQKTHGQIRLWGRSLVYEDAAPG